jgi:hypothetical protein
MSTVEINWVDSTWLPASPSLCDIALSYFLGEQTSTDLPHLVAVCASHLSSKFAISYCGLSDSGQKKLAGLEEEEVRILLQKVLACASTANDGLVFITCIRLANHVVNIKHYLA